MYLSSNPFRNCGAGDVTLSNEVISSYYDGADAVSAHVTSPYVSGLERTNETIPTIGSTTEWTIVAMAYWKCNNDQRTLTYFLAPYSVEEDPAEELPAEELPAEELGGYTLASDETTTKWITPDGKTVWTITEGEDIICADLTEWAALPQKLVKKWKDCGKAIEISYVYRGYSVAISLPAGELVDTDVEWYGPAYMAALNQKYVVVKDYSGMVVPNDRIYKK